MQHTLEMGHDENKGIGQEEGNGKLSSQADVKHSSSNCELQYVVWERRGPDQGKHSSCGHVTVHCIDILRFRLGALHWYLNLRVQVSDSSIDRYRLASFPRSGIAGDTPHTYGVRYRANNHLPMLNSAFREEGEEG